MHDDEPVGLAKARGDLGGELVGRDPGGGGQPCVPADLILHGLGQLAGFRDRARPLAHVEIALVQGKRFDERRVLTQDRPDALGHVTVVIHPRVDNHQLGTESPGTEHRHGGPDPEPARFVGRRCHHGAPRATADDDRLTRERGVIPLLHRGVEGVHVDVNDSAIHRLPDQATAGMTSRVNRPSDARVVSRGMPATETRQMRWVSPRVC